MSSESSERYVVISAAAHVGAWTAEYRPYLDAAFDNIMWGTDFPHPRRNLPPYPGVFASFVP